MAAATNLEEEHQLSWLHLILSCNSLEAWKSTDLPRVMGEQVSQHTSPMA